MDCKMPWPDHFVSSRFGFLFNPFHLFICLQDVCKMPWNAFLIIFTSLLGVLGLFFHLSPTAICAGCLAWVVWSWDLLSFRSLESRSPRCGVCCRLFSSSLISVCLPISPFFVVCTDRLAGFLVYPTTCHKHVPKFLATLASSTPEVVELWTPLQNGMTGSQLAHFLWLQVCYVGLGWFGCGLKLL